MPTTPHRDQNAWKTDLVLLFITAVWGGTFVTVQNAVSNYSVFSFLAIRFTLATFALLPLLARRARQKILLPMHARTWLGAAIVGSALFTGYALQTYGLLFTTPAKAGFITGLSVVFVPLAAAIMLRQAPSWNATAGVLLATAGLALMTLDKNLTIVTGDLLILGCALSFAAQILLVSQFSRHIEPLTLAVGQIATVAVLGWLATFFVDRQFLQPTGTVWFAAGFTGILATAFAFWAQANAQRTITPTRTALIFATEPVFAALFSYLLIGEQLTTRVIIGGVFILAGMLISELGNSTVKKLRFTRRA